MESRKRRFVRAIQILRIISEANAEPPNNLPNRYDVCKKLVPEFGTEPTILAAIAELDEAGLLYAKYVDKHARGGRPSKHYDLTLKGFELLLGGFHELGWKLRITTLVARHQNLLPELFGLWKRFQRQGIADLVQKYMLSICRVSIETFDQEIYALKMKALAMSKIFQAMGSSNYKLDTLEFERAFQNRLFASLEEEPNVADYFRFLEALTHDSQLKVPYMTYLHEKRAEQQGLLEEIEIRIADLNKEPNEGHEFDVSEGEERLGSVG